MRYTSKYDKPKHPNHFPATQYFADGIEEPSDGVVIESNGDLRLIRDEETGAEVYRFRRELAS